MAENKDYLIALKGENINAKALKNHVLLLNWYFYEQLITVISIGFSSQRFFFNIYISTIF